MENTQNNFQEEELYQIDLLMVLDDMWRALKKFWLFFLVLIVTCSMLAAFSVILVYSPRYQAYATFVVNAKTAYSSSDTYQEYYNEASADQLSKSFPYILTSGALNDVVAKSRHMDSIPATITAQSIADSALFTIQVQAEDPQLAYDVLQAVIENYPSVAEYIIGDTELTLMDESGVPEEPVNKLSFKRTVAKGILFSIGLSILFLFLYCALSKTVRREEDLKSVLSMTYLGNIPFIKVKKRSDASKSRILLDSQNNGDMLSESVRIVRNRITKETDEQEKAQILITSAEEGEGKTTVSVNLAISMALKGKKVILVDGDLRNPSVTYALGLPEAEFGTVDVLAGQKLTEQHILT